MLSLWFPFRPRAHPPSMRPKKSEEREASSSQAQLLKREDLADLDGGIPAENLLIFLRVRRIRSDFFRVLSSTSGSGGLLKQQMLSLFEGSGVE